MSRGSTLTLYRAYPKFKLTDEQFHYAVKQYVDSNRNSSLFRHCSEYACEKDLPVVMAMGPRWDDDRDDDPVHITGSSEGVNAYREKHYTRYFLRDEHVRCDKLLEWNFISGFDALISHFNLSYYGNANSGMLISSALANEMLSAIEYILGGDWDDRIARTMHNDFISVFTDGYNCNSYCKYVYRNQAYNGETFHFREGGCEVSVKLPRKKARDEIYDRESAESDSEIEYWLETFADGLRAFLKSDNWGSESDERLVLEYSCWG